MASGGRRGRPGHPGARALRRRRIWAAAAVLGCVAADVWSVTAAGARETAAPAGVQAVRPAAVVAGVQVAPDAVESVPDSLPVPTDGERSSDAPTPGDTSSGTATGGPAPTTPAPGATSRQVVVERGSGSFTVLPLPTDASTDAPATAGRVVRFTLEEEGGIGVDAAEYARTVVSVLTDTRGWQRVDGVRFVHVQPRSQGGATPDLRILLASPGTTDRLCAPLQTRGQVSCHTGGLVVLNARRWLLGADAYGADLAGYRTYLVNHEVGHGLGHGHATCPGAGRPAPVMVQQTYGLGGCTAWPWPSTAPTPAPSASGRASGRASAPAGAPAPATPSVAGLPGTPGVSR